MPPDQPRFVVHAVYGPPRPVLVLAVDGDLDSRDRDDLIAVLDQALALAGTEHGRHRYGCRQVASRPVLDLRRARFVSPRVLTALADRSPGPPPRLLIDPRHTTIPRLLHHLGLDETFTTHHTLTDAVLADVPVTDP